MNKTATLALLACTLLCVACVYNNKNEQQKNTFTDARDGKTYKTVKIGEQVWMAENLNYEARGRKCYGESGFAIEGLLDGKEPTRDRLSNTETQANCVKYGSLYDWKTAKAVCPKGWHLPTIEEWDVLYRYAVGTSDTSSPYSKTASIFLKATSGWKNKEGESGNGEDRFGFSALPGGAGESDGYFLGVGHVGGWWSSSEYNSDKAYGLYMGNNHAYQYNDSDKNLFISVRCLQGIPTQTDKTPSIPVEPKYPNVQQ